jgi:hypothetical protein
MKTTKIYIIKHMADQEYDEFKHAFIFAAWYLSLNVSFGSRTTYGMKHEVEHEFQKLIKAFNLDEKEYMHGYVPEGACISAICSLKPSMINKYLFRGQHKYDEVLSWNKEKLDMEGMKIYRETVAKTKRSKK